MRRFDATVPENSHGFCGTIATAPTRSWRGMWVTGWPSISTRPEVGEYSLGKSPASVVLPLPVEPMIAVVVPGAASNEMCSSTGFSAPG